LGKKKKMDNNILNIITSYLKDEPNKTQVEEVIANEALQEEIVFARQMQFTQTHKEEIQVQSILKDILAQAPDVQPDDELTEKLAEENIVQLPKTGGSNTWIWATSLIVGLIGIFAVTFYAGIFDMHTSAQREALNEMAVLPPFITEPNVEQKEAIDHAVITYNEKNYEAAIEHTKAYLKTAPSDNNMKMYLALSYLYDKQYESSLAIFRETERTSFTSKHLDYYMGIAHLMTDETKAAVSYFKQIPQENEHYLSAKQILQKLENE